MVFVIFFCIKFAVACDIDYLTQYKKQRWIDKKLVKKAKKQKTSLVTLKILLNLKADPNAIDEKGTTAFNHLFVPVKPCLEKVSLFLEHNVDCNKMSVSSNDGSLAGPLEYIFRGFQHVNVAPFIKLVLACKADPNQHDSKGQTLLHNVLLKGKYDEQQKNDSVALIESIISYKGDVNIRDYSKNLRTPFHILCSSVNYRELIPYFLEVRADVNSKDNYENTPFNYFVGSHKIASDIDLKLLSAFIECKVDLTHLLEWCLEVHGSDSLFCSYFQNYYFQKKSYDKEKVLNLIHFLLKGKANINAIERSRKLAIFSQNTFSPELIQCFLNYNMDPTTDIGCSSEVLFGYELAANKDKEKRNILAYAIPSYIGKKYTQQWETLLLCLKEKNKQNPAFNVPKYLKIALCGDVALKIREVLKEIRDIEKDNYWPYNHYGVFSLKKNIYELVEIDYL